MGRGERDALVCDPKCFVDSYDIEHNLAVVEFPSGDFASVPMDALIMPCRTNVQPKALWGAAPVDVLLSCDDWALVIGKDWRRPQVVMMASLIFEPTP